MTSAIPIIILYYSILFDTSFCGKGYSNIGIHNDLQEVCVITQYGSSVYNIVGIGMIFVFTLYIRKFSSCFQFQSQFDF